MHSLAMLRSMACRALNSHYIQSRWWPDGPPRALVTIGSISLVVSLRSREATSSDTIILPGLYEALNIAVFRSEQSGDSRQQGASIPLGDRRSNASAHTFCFGQHRLQQLYRSSESSAVFVFAPSLSVLTLSHQSSAATFVGCPCRIGPGREAWLVVSCSLEAFRVVVCSSRLPARSAAGHEVVLS